MSEGAFSCLVPRVVARRMRARHGSGPVTHAEDVQGAVLFVDVSSSTCVLEYLAQSTSDGLESFMELLDSYFAHVIECAEIVGGDLIKFGGDALLFAWAGDAISPANALALAGECALTILQRLKEFEGISGLRIAMRISLAYGTLRLAHMGGENGRWELLVAGPIMQQLRHIAPFSRPDTAVLSQEAHDALCSSHPSTSLVTRVDPETGCAELIGLASETTRPQEDFPPLLPEEDQALRAFVPGVLRPAAPSRHRHWLTERRTITVVLVRLPGLPGLVEIEMSEAQTLVGELQRICYRHEGTIVRLGSDDKGMSLMIAFGLAPFAHRDDPSRALEAALELYERCHPRDRELTIGVSTGPVICTLMGTERRCEYALVGGTVYRAVRLAQEAHGILCDRATVDAVQGVLQVRPLATVMVKGWSEPLEAFVPVGRMKDEAPVLLACPGAVTVASIMHELDRLSPERLWVLKVGSLLGESFRVEQLQGVFPFDEGRPRIGAHLHALQHSGLLSAHLRDGVRRYAFRHPLVRAAAYELMSGSQRRSLHAMLCRRPAASPGEPSGAPELEQVC